MRIEKKRRNLSTRLRRLEQKYKRQPKDIRVSGTWSETATFESGWDNWQTDNPGGYWRATGCAGGLSCCGGSYCLRSDSGSSVFTIQYIRKKFDLTDPDMVGDPTISFDVRACGASCDTGKSGHTVQLRIVRVSDNVVLQNWTFVGNPDYSPPQNCPCNSMNASLAAGKGYEVFIDLRHKYISGGLTFYGAASFDNITVQYSFIRGETD